MFEVFVEQSKGFILLQKSIALHVQLLVSETFFCISCQKQENEEDLNNVQLYKENSNLRYFKLIWKI